MLYYRLFPAYDGADIAALLNHLEILGKVEVRMEKDNPRKMILGASSLKIHTFKHLLDYIYKMNRVYTVEEMDTLQASINQLFGVFVEKIDSLREKLPRDVSNDLEKRKKQIEKINIKVFQNIQHIRNEDEYSKKLLHPIEEIKEEINNTLLKEAVLDQAVMKIKPPKQSKMGQYFDYNLTLFGTLITGGMSANFGFSYLLSMGLPLGGAVGLVVGLSLVVGFGLAYHFHRNQQERDKIFLNSLQSELKEARIKEMTMIAKQKQLKVQNIGTELSQKFKMQLDSAEKKNQGLAAELKRAREVITSQQKTLLVQAETNAAFRDEFSRIGRYMSHLKENLTEFKVEGPRSPRPPKVTITSPAVQFDPDLLEAKKHANEIQTLSNSIMKEKKRQAFWRSPSAAVFMDNEGATGVTPRVLQFGYNKEPD